MSTNEETLSELQHLLNGTLALPDGREVEIKAICTARALSYLRKLGELEKGGILAFAGMSDLIEQVGDDLGIKDELMAMDIEDTMKVILDFFGLLMLRMARAIRGLSDSVPSSRSTSLPTASVPGTMGNATGDGSGS